MSAVPRVLLAVTGSSHARVTPRLVASLQAHPRCGPLEVIVAASDAALQFFERSRVESLTRRPIFTSHTEGTDEFPIPHVNLAEWADVVLVYPATANTVAKCAHGICDTLIPTVVLAARCPIYFGPLMNDAMYDHPLTQANLLKLESAGYRQIPRETTWVLVRATNQSVRRPYCTENCVMTVCEKLFCAVESTGSEARLATGERESPGT